MKKEKKWKWTQKNPKNKQKKDKDKLKTQINGIKRKIIKKNEPQINEDI